MHSDRRAAAAKVLAAVAQKVQNPRLATLAMRVKLDAFTRVITCLIVEAFPAFSYLVLTSIDDGYDHLCRHISLDHSRIWQFSCVTQIVAFIGNMYWVRRAGVLMS